MPLIMAMPAPHFSTLRRIALKNTLQGAFMDPCITPDAVYTGFTATGKRLLREKGFLGRKAETLFQNRGRRGPRHILQTGADNFFFRASSSISWEKSMPAPPVFKTWCKWQVNVEKLACIVLQPVGPTDFGVAGNLGPRNLRP